MRAERISEVTTNRLSLYLRCLNELALKGDVSVSSEELARICFLNSAQIRKDLACFGEFGVRGVGYEVEALRANLKRILGLNRVHSIAIAGAGRLGSALADYYAGGGRGFQVKAVFDIDETKIGRKVGGVEIFDVKNFSSIVKKGNIEVAVIAVPAEAAQETLEMIEAAGIRAILNFAPVPLSAGENVKLNTVDLSTSLENLSFYLKGNGNGSRVHPR
jgi:redox-sensing transcriptional repressor